MNTPKVYSWWKYRRDILSSPELVEVIEIEERGHDETRIWMKAARGENIFCSPVEFADRAEREEDPKAEVDTSYPVGGLWDEPKFLIRKNGAFDRRSMRGLLCRHVSEEPGFMARAKFALVIDHREASAGVCLECIVEAARGLGLLEEESAPKGVK